MEKVTELLACGDVYTLGLHNVSSPCPQLKNFQFDLFISLDIGTVAYGVWNEELGISYANLSNSYATNTAALAVGGVILIPLTLKYGRRPMYLATSLALTLSSVWMAQSRVLGDFIGSNLISGLAGAVGDAIVQMTVRSFQNASPETSHLTCSRLQTSSLYIREER